MGELFYLIRLKSRRAGKREFRTKTGYVNMKKIFVLIGVLCPLLAMAEWIGLAPEPANLDGRSAAMGNTDLLSVKGSNAIFSNPALIPFGEVVMQCSGSGWFFGNGVYFVDNGIEEDFDHEMNIPNLNMSLVKDIYNSKKISVSGGIGLYSFYNRSYKEEFDDHSEDFNSVLYSMTPSLAVDVNDFVSVGLSYNYLMDNKFNLDNYYTSGDDYEKVKSDYLARGSFLLVGVSAKISDILSVSMSHRSRFDLNKNDHKTKSEECFEDLGTENYEHVMSDYSETIPEEYAVGFTCSPMEETLFSCEYNYVHMKDAKVSYKEGDVSVERDFFKQYTDGHSLKMGLELGEKIPIRVGYFYDFVPRSDDVDSRIDKNRRFGVTLGTGYDFGKCYVDVFYQHVYHFVKQNDEFERSLHKNYFGASLAWRF